MNQWELFDETDEGGMYINESLKKVVRWQLYGDNDQYFLSREGYYENDCCEDDIELDTLVNRECSPDSLEALIEQTKDMAGIND